MGTLIRLYAVLFRVPGLSSIFWGFCARSCSFCLLGTWVLFPQGGEIPFSFRPFTQYSVKPWFSLPLKCRHFYFVRYTWPFCLFLPLYLFLPLLTCKQGKKPCPLSSLFPRHVDNLEWRFLTYDKKSQKLSTHQCHLWGRGNVLDRFLCWPPVLFFEKLLSVVSCFHVRWLLLKKFFC